MPLSLRSLATRVLHLFKFRIHDVLATRPALGGGPARSTTGGRFRARALLGGLGALRDAGGGLRESLGLLVDGAPVLAPKRGAQIRHRAFDPCALRRGLRVS